MKPAPLAGIASVVFAAFAIAANPPALNPPLPAAVWRLDRADEVGGVATTVLGDPESVTTKAGHALEFDGMDDGIIVPANPIAGFSAFTVEILVRPAAGGNFEQRFLHIAESDNHRLLIELRMTESGHWYVDTFLRDADSHLPLIDKTLLHPADTWTWVALRYEGGRMTHFVNGVKECEGEVTFGPMMTGQTSIGVRLNRVSWFKGAIAEVRFHNAALDAARMQRAVFDDRPDGMGPRAR